MSTLTKDELKAAFASITQAIDLNWNYESGASYADIVAGKDVHNGNLDIHVYYLSKKDSMLDYAGRWSAIVKGHFPFAGDVPLNFTSNGDDPVQAIKIAIFNVALHIAQLLDYRKRGYLSPRTFTDEEAGDMEKARLAIQKIVDGLQ